MPQPAHSGRRAKGSRVKISEADMKKAEREHKEYVERQAQRNR